MAPENLKREVEGENMQQQQQQKANNPPWGDNLGAGQCMNTKCPLRLQYWLHELHHMLKVEQARLAKLRVFCFGLFSQRQWLHPALTTPSLSRKSFVEPWLHFQGGRTASPPARRLIKCLNHSIIAQQWSLTLVKQFVLIMEITSFSFQISAGSCEPLQVKIGCGSPWVGTERGWGRPGLSWRSPVRGVWGGGGGGGPEVPGKGPGCKGGSDRCHALVTQGPHGSRHKRDHTLILPDIRRLPRCTALRDSAPKRNNNRQTPRLTLPPGAWEGLGA